MGDLLYQGPSWSQTPLPRSEGRTWGQELVTHRRSLMPHYFGSKCKNLIGEGIKLQIILIQKRFPFRL